MKRIAFLLFITSLLNASVFAEDILMPNPGTWCVYNIVLPKEGIGDIPDSIQNVEVHLKVVSIKQDKSHELQISTPYATLNFIVTPEQLNHELQKRFLSQKADARQDSKDYILLNKTRTANVSTFVWQDGSALQRVEIWRDKDVPFGIAKIIANNFTLEFQNFNITERSALTPPYINGE